VVTCSARDKDHTPASSDDAQVRLESSEGDGVGVKVDAASHRVNDRLGLLVDLLLHEVVERSLHDGRELNLERLDGANRRHAVVATEAVDVELCAETAPRQLPSFFPVDEEAPTHLPQQCARCHRPRGTRPAWCARQWPTRRKQ
jgi:hypothetical protein